MKENSIEEDIKIINNFITYFNKNIQNGNKADLTVLGEEINAIEHILSDYKRVLEENEQLSTEVNSLKKENEELKEENEYNKILLDMNNNFTIDKKTRNYKWNVIEIQKIKDKIEELNKEIKSCTEIDAIFKIKQEQILQELLESE